MSVSYDFSGRVAVVTGGSAGIGAEIAQHYTKAGAKVVVWDLASPKDKSLNYVQVDVSDQLQVDAAMTATLEECGRLDFLSHNAGYAGPTLSVADSDPAVWEQVVDVNLVGTFRVCRAATKEMLKSGSGRIINMASLAGKEGTPYASAYSAAKAGVIGFTKSLAKELAETDIRVNSIAPAAVETGILDQMAREFVQTMIDKSPMKRLGTVEEVARLVMWLSSDDCTFNSGAVFDLSGGRATY